MKSSPGRSGSRRRVTALVLAAALALPAAVTAPGSAQASPKQDYGSAAGLARRFANPPVQDRPFYRYWHPGGRMDPDTLKADFTAMREGGAGGVELSNFVRNNSVAPINDYDPATQGFGTDAWRERFSDAYAIGKSAGLQVDTTYTSKWSANLASVSPDGPGSEKELTLATAWLAAGQEYAGRVPQPTLPDGVHKADLVALRAYPCSSKCDDDVPVLDPTGSVNLKDRVSGDEQLRWKAPDGRWVLVASWMHGTGQLVEGAETPGTSYLVDHFSRAGIDAIESFWNEHLLTKEVRARLKASGGSLFFDSLELNPGGEPLRNWTADFLKEFRKRRGYDVEPYIPTLAVSGPQFELPGSLAERVREDYRQTLNDLFRDDHLLPLRTWAHSLGLTLRGQPYSSWGPTFVDPMEASSLLDIPEGEDRSFNAGASQGLIETQGADAWRSMATAAQLSGRPLVSDECCASFGRAYRVTRQKLLSHVNENFSAGVNNVVWHGWSHDAPGTAVTWPGWAGFGNTGVDDAYGPQNPTWADDRRINDYVARLQTALRTGRQLTDIAIYHQKPGHSSEGTVGERYFTSSALEQLGFTYGFVNTTLLAGHQMSVANRMLAPQGPGFHAFVVDRESAMDLASARRIVTMARQGLPGVVVGDAPQRALGDHPGDDAAVRAAFEQLHRFGTVRWVAAEDDVPQALTALGVQPRAAFASPSSLVGVQRSGQDVNVYYWYNASDKQAKATVSVAARGIPYQLDPWTGRTEPVASYAVKGDHTVVNLDVAPGDIALVAVSDKPLAGTRPPSTHVVSTTAGQVVLDGGTPLLRATENGRQTTVLSDGRQVVTDVRDVPTAQSPTRWQLSVASWHQGSSPQQTQITQLPEQQVTAASDTGLLPAWSTLPGMQSVSGVGTYRTTFDVDLRERAGAYLDLGQVTTTYRVAVNGRSLPPADQLAGARIDIGPYLRSGRNEVVVTVASMLGNAIAGKTVNSYGLVGPVRLIPYVDVPLSAR
ncbi:glycosyl hydrolase [Actinoallomurus iriomotensis]|uniref:glycosyl hydrolase n=1 Tax=Actinoallomurus iriomotensis TaxID=478107 RepID=UPI00255514F5|nr:glycosyl hydrolase [Actinoallomurus iriomotensis]